jgi:hypothetical protein
MDTSSSFAMMELQSMGLINAQTDISKLGGEVIGSNELITSHYLPE